MIKAAGCGVLFVCKDWSFSSCWMKTLPDLCTSHFFLSFECFVIPAIPFNFYGPGQRWLPLTVPSYRFKCSAFACQTAFWFWFGYVCRFVCRFSERRFIKQTSGLYLNNRPVIARGVPAHILACVCWSWFALHVHASSWADRSYQRSWAPKCYIATGGNVLLWTFTILEKRKALC